MVKNRHNHTCGLSEMLIEVASELNILSTKSFGQDRSVWLQGECNGGKNVRPHIIPIFSQAKFGLYEKRDVFILDLSEG